MALNVGIDLGSRGIKVVAGRMKGPVFEIQRAFTIPVESGAGAGAETEDSILAAAGGLAAELPKKAPGARISLSGPSLIIRYTQVPSVPTWRLRKLMDFEVREMAHQAGESLASDYNLVSVPGKGDGSETVLVAVVKERFLEARHQAVTAVAGEPKAGMPSSLALFNSYLHSGALHEGEFVFLVDIGDRNTEIVLQKDGELLFARNLAAGGGLMTDSVAGAFGLDREAAERLKEQLGNVTPKGQAAYGSGKEEKVANAIIGPTGQLASMIQSSLAFSRAQTGIRDLKVGRILLSGGGANLRGLPEYLAASFACPVERFQPESGLETSALPAEEAAAFQADPGRFAVALGLAIAGARPEAFLVDLVPERTKKKRAVVQKSLFLWLSGAAALIVLVLHFLQLSGLRADLQEKERRARLEAGTARRQSDQHAAGTAKLGESNLRQQALDERTKLNYALAVGSRIAQENCPEGIWIEQVEAARIPVKNEADPTKSAGFRPMVKVNGEIVSVDVQAETALQDMITALKRVQPDWGVTIDKQGGGAAAGSKKLSFVVKLDPWPPPAPPAKPTEGGAP